MLPHKSLQRALIGSVVLAICGVFVGVEAPAQAYRNYAPSVDSLEIPLRAVTPIVVVAGKEMMLYPEHATSEFSLVGVTWSGAIDPTSRFEVKVRESGQWSEWTQLPWSLDHGADADSSEAKVVRQGTDPLLTAPANGIAVRVTNDSGKLPKTISLSLVNSRLTMQDRSLISIRPVATSFPNSVTSPQGAVVARPKLITRAQWGANESWRNEDPGMGTKIIAGFLHHTASTNNYSAAQGPAQMRNLYSYYTRSLHYKDLAYSFLVDKYGNVYEGRSGCPRVVTTPCDGPSRPAIGAHTAGMNVDTFAISAIGNFHEASPGNEALAVMDNAIAGLMAWKIAPYGLDPKAIANIPMGSDPHHLSRYREGDVAHVLTISGHRDVGQTVCPGKYLYPELPAIRDRIASLLTPVVAIPKVIPNVVANDQTDPISISSVIVGGASWAIDILNDVDGSVVGHAEGLQTTVGPITYSWPHLDANNNLLPAGTYTVRVQQTLNSAPSASPTPTGTQTATPTPSTSSDSSSEEPTSLITQRTGKVTIATAPKLQSAAEWKYRSRTRAWVLWKPATSFVPVTYQYRVFDKTAKTWTNWKSTKISNSRITVRKLVLWRSYRLQLKAINAVGESRILESNYVHKYVK